MNHYYSEIIRIGNKFNLDSNITKMIFEYNKGTYPIHYEVKLKNEYNITFELKCCVPGKIYFHNECNYCNELIYCKNCYKYIMRKLNHKLCNNCNQCININDKHNYCNNCNECHNGSHFYCNNCNECHNDSHFYCNECNICYDNKNHYYHNPDMVNDKNDLIQQIKFYLDINDQLHHNAKRENIMILFRIGLKFIQIYDHNNIKNTIENKLNEMLNLDTLNLKHEILVYRYKKIISKL